MTHTRSGHAWLRVLGIAMAGLLVGIAAHSVAIASTKDRVLPDEPRWMIVEVPDDPDWTTGIAVEYSNEFLLDHDEEVEASIATIERLPGVESVWREDDDLVIVEGSIGPRDLERALREWWKSAGVDK